MAIGSVLIFLAIPVATSILISNIWISLVVTVIMWNFWWLGWLELTRLSARLAREEAARIRDEDVSVLLLSPRGEFIVLSPDDRMGPWLKRGYRKVKLY